MKLTIPIFRAGKYSNGDIRAMVPDGRVTAAHVKEIAENTTKAITNTTWRPRAKLGHGKGRPTIGWVEKPPTAQGRLLVAEVDLNADGDAQVKGKKARFWSCEIDTGASLFGDDDSERLGLRLGAVSLLPDSDPQIKDLGDSFTAAEFSEEETAEMGAAGFRVVREFMREEAGRIAYFAEIEEAPPAAPQPTTAPAEPDKESSMLTKEEEQALRDQLAAANQRSEKLQADAAAAVAAAQFGERRASFAEHTRRVKEIVKSGQTKETMKFGSSTAHILTQIGMAMFGAASVGGEQVAEFSDVIVEEKVVIKPDQPLALFAELVASMGSIVPTTPLGEGREPAGAVAQFSEKEFSSAGIDPEVSQRINAAFIRAKRADAKLTFANFRAQATRATAN